MVVKFTRTFKYYLLGRQFTARTDHSSLQWLVSLKEPRGQLARWFYVLSEYDMIIKHKEGSKHVKFVNVIADSLSRISSKPFCPNFNSDVELSSLPCYLCIL